MSQSPVEVLPNSHRRPAIPQLNSMTTELTTARTAVLSGRKAPAQALQEANQNVTLAIQENRDS